MSDTPLQLDLGLSDAGVPVVLLGARGTVGSMAELLRLAPELVPGGRATDLALAVNHLAHGVDYRVITDPRAYEAQYRARLLQEDPEAPWQEGVVRLSDFGVPDFAAIHAPRLDGGRLTFYAADAFLGVPYKVELPEPAAEPSYTPAPLTPLSGPAGPAPASQITPLTPEEIEARRTHMAGDLPG